LLGRLTHQCSRPSEFFPGPREAVPLCSLLQFFGCLQLSVRRRILNRTRWRVARSGISSADVPVCGIVVKIDSRRSPQTESIDLARWKNCDRKPVDKKIGHVERWIMRRLLAGPRSALASSPSAEGTCRRQVSALHRVAMNCSFPMSCGVAMSRRVAALLGGGALGATAVSGGLGRPGSNGGVGWDGPRCWPLARRPGYVGNGSTHGGWINSRF